MAPLVRAHWPIGVLIVAGATVRALAMVAFPPALFFNDSWGYLFTAFTGHPVSLSYLRPNGYPVLVHVLTLPARDLAQLVALQHLAGLLTGLLVYLVVIRARGGRGLATLAAALVLLDGYAITVEQYVMPEAFFTLTLLLAALAVMAVIERSETRAVSGLSATAGLLLAGAAIQREAALFLVPVFLAYLIWSRVGVRRFALFLVALATPLLAYAALYDARLGVFGLSETSGWTLYGRVAGVADCTGVGVPAGERPLCESRAQRASHPTAATWYIWDRSSPAARLFHGGHQTRQTQAHSDAILGSFARRIILHQPLDYLGLVGGDVIRYFMPGATPFNDAVSATSLPASAAAEPRSERVRRRVLPSVRPEVTAPAALLRRYRDIVHVPRPLLALLLVASAAALALKRPSPREVLLFAGSGLALIVGTAASAGFGIRYLLPAVPLLAIGGAVALGNLLARQTLTAERPPHRVTSAAL